MSDGTRDLLKTMVIAAAIIGASLILAGAIHYLADAINAGLRSLV